MTFYYLIMLLTIKLALNNPGYRKFTYFILILIKVDFLLSQNEI